MKKLILALLFLSIMPASAMDTNQTLIAAEQGQPAWMQKSQQLVVVTAPDWISPNGTLQRYARSSDNAWQPKGDPIPVILGKNGLGWGLGLHPADAAMPDDPIKKEGDGKAPAGVFSLPSAFAYDPTQINNTTMPVVDVAPDLYCVDDPDSAQYNTLQRLQAGVQAPWKSAEEMQRKDDLYKLGIIVEHNQKAPVPGRGSCIFMHIARANGSPTVGCTAMKESALQTLIQWLSPTASPVLVQLPTPVYARLRSAWGLP